MNTPKPKTGVTAGVDGTDDLPYAEYDGIVRIGNAEIDCAVLNDGRRVLTQQGMLLAIGRTRTAKGGQGASIEGGYPAFLAAKNLRAFIPDEIKAAMTPIVYKPLNGGYRRRAFGYAPDLLKLTCQVYVDALNRGSLTGAQIPIAQECRALLSALESLAIVALIDEATGYQAVREHDALQRLVALYVNEEYRKWEKRFPDEYYHQLFRLLKFDPYNPKPGLKPPLIGKLTDEIIYKRLPTEVRTELRKRNPVVRGVRKRKHHQFLTADVGNHHLNQQLAVATAVMRGFNDIRSFLKFYSVVAPKPIVKSTKGQQALPLFDAEDQNSFVAATANSGHDRDSEADPVFD